MKYLPTLLACSLLVACSQPTQTTQTSVTPSPAVSASPVSSTTPQASSIDASESTPKQSTSETTAPKKTTQPDAPSEPVRVAQAPNKTAVPITLISFQPARRGGVARGVFIVPDRDTTRSAYGGSLRLYDVHISKMLEVSNLYCNPNSGNWTSVEWNYFAGDGDINMGKFQFDCSLVQQVVAYYGLGRPEQTTIYYYGNAGKSTVEQLPVLDLYGTKIKDFLRFVQNQKPLDRAERIDLS